MTSSSTDPTSPSPAAAGTPAPASIVVQRRIEWSDTDASGMYHNTAAFRLIEVAETALFDRLGFVHEIYGRLPRAHIDADFLAPLRFRDLVDASLEVREVGRTSATYAFAIHVEGTLCVRATVVTVLLDRAGGAPVPWRPEHRAALLTAGPQASERLIEDRPAGGIARSATGLAWNS